MATKPVINNINSLKKQSLYKAVVNAFSGMKYFFLHERNGKLQLLVSVFAVALAVGLRLNKTETVITTVCCALVLSLEMINTAIENLCNVVQEEYHPLIKIIKDVAAGAVLLVSIASVAIGLIIFFPKIFNL